MTRKLLAFLLLIVLAGGASFAQTDEEMQNIILGHCAATFSYGPGQMLIAVPVNGPMGFVEAAAPAIALGEAKKGGQTGKPAEVAIIVSGLIKLAQAFPFCFVVPPELGIAADDVADLLVLENDAGVRVTVLRDDGGDLVRGPFSLGQPDSTLCFPREDADGQPIAGPETKEIRLRFRHGAEDQVHTWKLPFGLPEPLGSQMTAFWSSQAGKLAREFLPWVAADASRALVLVWVRPSLVKELFLPGGAVPPEWGALAVRVENDLLRNAVFIAFRMEEPRGGGIKATGLSIRLPDGGWREATPITLQGLLGLLIPELGAQFGAPGQQDDPSVAGVFWAEGFTATGGEPVLTELTLSDGSTTEMEFETAAPGTSPADEPNSPFAP